MPEGNDRNKVTRREFLGKTAKIGAGIAAASVASKLVSKKSDRFSALAAGKDATKFEAKEGLAEGMIGGPTGFPGAEKFQYGPDEAAGRAIEGIRKFVAEGKAPKKLVYMVPPGEPGHWESPFPEGAKPLKDIFFEETGIELEIVSVIDTEQGKKLVQDYQTGTNTYDVYGMWENELGDLARSGALSVCDDWVEKYKPDWEDSVWGFVGGAVTVNTMMKVAGHYYGFHTDGDYPCFHHYRKDLWESDKERNAFRQRYGWELQVPDTWEQLDQIAEFFHRPPNLLGNVGLRLKWWGFAWWYPRYISFANPNRYYFDEDGNPLINSKEGIQATQEYVDSLKWMHEDAITWGWSEQYGAMAAGACAMVETFQNFPKFNDNPDNPGCYNKVSSFGSPGRIVNGKLIRRSVWWPCNGKGVAAGGKNPELAYLFLQWLSSGKIFAFLIANPAGYLDPCRIQDFTDPQVIESYKPYCIDAYIDVLEHAAPCINVPGVLDFQNALDENLLEAIVGKKTAAQAMEDTEKRWKKTIETVGRDEFVAAVSAQNPAWPTITERPKI
jgi:multiple sugar transport system substrate-binding protein